MNDIHQSFAHQGLIRPRDERVLPNPARGVRTRGRRVEQRIEVVRTTYRGRAVADHGGVPHRRTALVRRGAAMRCVVMPPGLRLVVEDELQAERRRRERRRRTEKPPPGEFRHA